MLQNVSVSTSYVVNIGRNNPHKQKFFGALNIFSSFKFDYKMFKIQKFAWMIQIH